MGKTAVCIDIYWQMLKKCKTYPHLIDKFTHKSKVLLIDFVVLHPANITDPCSTSFSLL